MAATTVGLLLISALAHATWNLLAKRSGDKVIFVALLDAAVGVVLLPLALYWLSREPLTWATAPLVVVSGLIQVFYAVTLGRGYRVGDLSLVYPVARGSGAVLVAVLAIPLFGERPAALGACGIATIIVGIYVAHLPGLAPRHWMAPLRAVAKSGATRYALLNALTICSYTLWDRNGVTHVSPLLYGYFGFAIPPLVMLPYLYRRRREALRAEVRRSLGTAAASGLLAYLAYGLVLVAFTTAKVGYVAVTREVGIVFGALLGAAFLKERHGLAKVAGAALIFGGIALIAASR